MEIEEIAEYFILQNTGLYGGAAAAAWYARFNRKPPWSFPRTAFFATVGSIGGLALSSVAVAVSLYRSFEGFQDNARFKQAIENLRAGRAVTQGIPVPHMPNRADVGTESTPWAQSTGDGSELLRRASSPFIVIHSVSLHVDPYEAPSEGQPVAASNSRWADIRAANNTAKTSTWDRIREQQAKANMPPSSSPPSAVQPTPANPLFSGIPVPSSTPSKKPGAGVEGELESNGEVLDKDAFDALLEAERNFGMGQDKKQQTRWS